MAILNEAKLEYEQLLKSGFFWEFYPDLSGDWETDKEEWQDVLYPSLQNIREKFKNK